MVGPIKIINYLCYSISIVHVSYTVYIDDMANFLIFFIFFLSTIFFPTTRLHQQHVQPPTSLFVSHDEELKTTGVHGS